MKAVSAMQSGQSLLSSSVEVKHDKHKKYVSVSWSLSIILVSYIYKKATFQKMDVSIFRCGL